MAEIIKLDDPFSYVVNDRSQAIEGVQWLKKGQYINIDMNGSVHTLIRTDKNIEAHELRQLMIMWLALTYPDTLKFDDLEKENMIREETD